MKKVLLAASLLIAVGSFAGINKVATVKASIETEKGRHIPESQVPAAIVASFYSQYPGATNVRWELETEHGRPEYEAKFLLNGVRMKVKFRG